MGRTASEFDTHTHIYTHALSLLSFSLPLSHTHMHTTIYFSFHANTLAFFYNHSLRSHPLDPPAHLPPTSSPPIIHLRTTYMLQPVSAPKRKQLKTFSMAAPQPKYRNDKREFL